MSVYASSIFRQFSTFWLHLQEGIPVLIVVIIGIVLLMLNVCGFGSVMYQKYRVRQREDNLRRRIKRLSDAGMISNGNANDLEPAPRYCGVSNDNGHVCNNNDAEDSEDEASADDDEDACSHHDHHPRLLSAAAHEAASASNVYVIAHDHHHLHHGFPKGK